MKDFIKTQVSSWPACCPWCSDGQAAIVSCTLSSYRGERRRADSGTAEGSTISQCPPLKSRNWLNLNLLRDDPYQERRKICSERQAVYFLSVLVSCGGRLGGVGGQSLCSRLGKADVTHPWPLIGQYTSCWRLIGQHCPALPPPQLRCELDVSSVIPGPPWCDHHFVTHIESVTQRDIAPVTPGHPGTSLLPTVNDFPNTGCIIGAQWEEIILLEPYFK